MISSVAATAARRPPALVGRPPAVGGRTPALAVRPPVAVGRQSVGYEEKAKIIFFVKNDKKKGNETKLTVRSINKRLSEEKKRRREGRKGQILTQQTGRAPREEKERQDNVVANEGTTLMRAQPYR